MPKRFYQQIIELEHRGKELGIPRPERDLARSKVQMQYLSKVSTLFSEMRKQVRELRANLILLLEALHTRNEKLIPRWIRNQPTPPTIGRASSAEPLGDPETSPPAPVLPPPNPPEKRIIMLVKRPNEPMRAELRAQKLLKATV